MKRINILLIFFALILITIGLLIFATCWTFDTKSLISQYAGVLVTGIGFILAIYQYFHSENKKQKDYLDLIVETKTDNDYYSIKTQVLNKSGEIKDIVYAFALITPQDENIVNAIQTLVTFKQWDIEIKCSNHFFKLKEEITSLLLFEKMVIIPLSFYYSENIRIGNENPCYTYSFDNKTIGLDKGIYSVRFFIYPKIGYHRSTVDSLVIN